jgi:hypothetical protein
MARRLGLSINQKGKDESPQMTCNVCKESGRVRERHPETARRFHV